MQFKAWATWLMAFLVIAAGSQVASAQAYPSKVVRLITAEPGGSYDFGARVVAQELSQVMGQQFIVENRGGVLAVLASKAAPDGYTLLVSGTNLWLQPFFHKTEYDPIRDFAPISLLNAAPNVLVVHPSLPVKTVKELIALARARPGELNYGTGNAGSASHLATEQFSAMTRISLVRVPYKGGGPAITALMGGQVQLIFATGGTVGQHMRSGRLRALGVTSLEPSALFPGLEPIAKTLPGYEAIGVVGVLAPAKTPAPIIERLNQEINRFLLKADVKERFFNSGVEAGGTTPERFAALIKSDMSSTGKLIKDTGLNHQ